MDTKRLTMQAVRALEPQTPYKLAKVLGVKPDTVYAWRDGKTMPNAKHLLRLIELAGKTIAGVATISALLLLGFGDQNASAANRVAFDRATHYAQLLTRLR